MQGDYDRRSYTAGEKIFSEGDRAGEAYLVHSGEVLLHKSENGVDVEIDTVGKGQIFGEMGVISDMNRMASADALSDTTLTCCHRSELLRRLEELDQDRRDALQFLIVYCQDFLPFELMDSRSNDQEIRSRDGIAARLIRNAQNPSELDGLDNFLAGLYKVLIGYAERRLPPHLME